MNFLRGLIREILRRQRNEQRIQELYPAFRDKIRRVLLALEQNGHRPRIQEAWRSLENQKKVYDSGHSKVLYGFHNVTGKNGRPESLAVDILDDRRPLTPNTNYLLQLAAAAEKEGLETGIRWGVAQEFIPMIDGAIHSGNWNADIKVGWDPTHI
jgi:hypothetical protein